MYPAKSESCVALSSDIRTPNYWMLYHFTGCEMKLSALCSDFYSQCIVVFQIGIFFYFVFNSLNFLLFYSFHHTGLGNFQKLFFMSWRKFMKYHCMVFFVAVTWGPSSFILFWFMNALTAAILDFPDQILGFWNSN
jgi:hypothetical protein